MKCAPGIDAAPGTPLEIHLFHFLGISVETKLTGKIVWHANGLAEYMGIVFDEKINEESQPELYRFICESCDQTADQADKK